MALGSALRSFDRQIERDNRQRAERLKVVEAPAVVVDAPVELPTLTQPPAYMFSDKRGEFAVRYRYLADRMHYNHRVNDPADLVRFMRDFLSLKAVEVVAVFAFPRCAVCERVIGLREETCEDCRQNCAEDSGQKEHWER